MIYAMRDLRYFLIQAETRWMESFHILETRRRVWNDTEIVVYALCTSHAVSVRTQRGELTELLSCRGHIDMKPSLAELAACRPFEMSTRFEGLRYRFRLSLQRLEGGDSLLGTFAPADEIVAAYPQLPGLDTPLTRIGWKIDPRALTVETLHTYPEEAAGVRSESVFEIDREGLD